MKKRGALLFLGFCLLSACSTTNSVRQADEPFIYRPFRKAGRGIVNVATAPLEVINQSLTLAGKGKTQGEILSGYISGATIGIGWTAWRGVSGLFDVATFPLFFPERALIEPEFLTWPGYLSFTPESPPRPVNNP